MVIEPVSSLYVYFRQIVADASERRKVSALPETTDYLANLLATFAHGDNARQLIERSVVLTLDEALARGPGEQLLGLQTVGDCSLYLVSFFPGYLDRAHLDAALYVNVGAFAYGRAAQLVQAAGASEPAVLLELNTKFERFVDVLGEVAESSALGAVTKSLVQLFDRWKTTGSSRALESMARLGAFPARGGGKAC